MQVPAHKVTFLLQHYSLLPLSGLAYNMSAEGLLKGHTVLITGARCGLQSVLLPRIHYEGVARSDLLAHS